MLPSSNIERLWWRYNNDGVGDYYVGGGGGDDEDGARVDDDDANYDIYLPDSYIERLNFRCPGEDDDDGDDESDGRS